MFNTCNTVTSSAPHWPNHGLSEFIPRRGNVQFNENANFTQSETYKANEQIIGESNRAANVAMAPSVYAPVHQVPAQAPSLNYNQPLSFASALQLPRDFPQLEVIKFDGDPSKYAKFMRTFEQTVDSSELSENKKLLYLVQHCKGEAKQLIEYCCLLNAQDGYAKALELLKDNYGRPNVIARSYCEKLTKGPPIKPDDLKGLCNLAQVMEESEVTLNCLNYQADLDNFNTMITIVKRLPYALQNRWLRTAAEIEKRGTDAKFKNLVKFIKDEAEIAKSSFASAVNQRNKKKGGVTFFTKSEKTKFSSTKLVAKNFRKCAYCKDDHKIEDCSKFVDLTISDRVSFTRRNRLCDNCFKGGHISRFCKFNSACTIKDCTRKHHTLLHREFPNQNSSDSHSPSSNPLPDTNRSAYFAANDNNCVFLNVVPVKVLYNDREVATYAFLDQGSTTTLCDQSLLDELGIKGENVSFALTTVNKKDGCYQSKKTSLTIAGVDNNEVVELREVLSVRSLPLKPNRSLTINELNTWPHLEGLHIPKFSAPVGLLIGVDNPELFWTLEERRGNQGQPYAVRTRLGWSLIGAASAPEQTKSIQVNFVRGSDQELDVQIERLWKMDLVPDATNFGTGTSKEDRLALISMKESKLLVDGHYQIALPWKPGAPNLDDNRILAESRLNNLRKRLDKNPEMKQRYTSVIEDYLAKDYAGKVEEETDSEMRWYLPHHAVLHPRKPDKVRVVFDCSVTFKGKSLNQQLLQGPDLLNSLIGVLLRFREGRIAMVSDIESMFHQVRVDPKDHSLLRFLWWPQGDTSLPPVDYCMKVHLFGATSSPSCANFSLLQTAEDNSDLYEPKVLETVKRNFYMDDCLISASTKEEAMHLYYQLTDLLKKGGFHLTKWISSCNDVLQQIPDAEKSTSAFNLNKDNNLRVLGVKWDFASDNFQFETNVKSKPLTRRGILSITSSLFDPLGFVAPVILRAKLLLQNLFRLKLGWDDKIPDEDAEKWNCWVQGLNAITKLNIPRFLFARDCDNSYVKSIQVHHFGDASSSAYGVVTYLRFVYENDIVFCRFIFGKARLAPLKTISIPRLELMAAVLAVKIDKMLQQELTLPNWHATFWTDSTAVLQMIANTNKRFPVFIANRLTKIEEHTTVDQWRYVPSKENPADLASRGIDAESFVSNSNWFQGPEFLLDLEDLWPQAPCPMPQLPVEFSVLKKSCNAVSKMSPDLSMEVKFSRFSTWYELKRSVAWILRVRDKLLRKDLTLTPISVDELERAERAILECVQRESFAKEITRLRAGKTLCKQHNRLLKLRPYICDAILRVGGRLQQSQQPYDVQHPIILPSSSHVTKLIIEDHHRTVGHSGTSLTWTSLRQKFWIIGGAAAVRKTIGNCFQCKKRNAKPLEQFMADLPKERFAMYKPPFYNVGTDYFGPFFIKQGRRLEKRYGCIFTCLTTRAVHLEVAHSMTADSFINAFRRFICRRTKPNTVLSDNGTNLVGAEKELRQALKDFNHKYVEEKLRQKGIRWKFNPPTASHFGGIWERLIRSTRKILSMLLQQQTVTDETLLTLFAEVECILNSRPLTPIVIDPEANLPLTPNHLLKVGTFPSLSPGVFLNTDVYSKHRWRQVQYMADQFWARWSREYLQTLQVRQKWTTKRPNLQIGDIVLVCDKTVPRGQWNMGRVIDTFPDRHNVVRQALVKTSTSELRRPISKLCLILKSSQEEVSLN